jgi:two-component system response regulator DevR
LVISDEACLCVVGEAASADDLIKKLAESTPHILLLDWGLPAEPTDQLLERIRRLYPRMSVLVISRTPQTKVPSLMAGADRFVSKVEPPSRLIAALRDLALARKLEEGSAASSPCPPRPKAPGGPL